MSTPSEEVCCDMKLKYYARSGRCIKLLAPYDSLLPKDTSDSYPINQLRKFMRISSPPTTCMDALDSGIVMQIYKLQMISIVQKGLAVLILISFSFHFKCSAGCPSTTHTNLASGRLAKGSVVLATIDVSKTALIWTKWKPISGFGRSNADDALEREQKTIEMLNRRFSDHAQAL